MVIDREVLRGRALGRARLLVRIAIEELSPPQREALLWRLGYEDGKEYGSRTIAKKCGVSYKAIEQRLQNGEQALGRRRWSCFLKRALDSLE